MKITVPITKSTSFYLTPEQGTQIRDAIMMQIDVSFTFYIEKVVQMHRPNISTILAGNRVTTINNLRKLLSGTRIEIQECVMSFTLESTSGGIVKPATSPTLEEMSYLQESNESDLEYPETFNTPSSELVKPQGRLKTLLATRSWEQAEDTSESSSEE